jgi:hypothetical protein
MADRMKCIFDQIDLFVESTESSLELPYELMGKERAMIHQYVQDKGLYSESKAVKGSRDKQIVVVREKKCSTDETKRCDVLNETDVELFAQYSRLPIPSTDPSLLEYYLKQYDPFYGCVESYNLFKNDMKRHSVKYEIVRTTKAIGEYFDKNMEYRTMMSAKQHDRKTEKMERLRKDIYTIENAGKYFVSFDIRSANFTVLRDCCPSLFSTSGGTSGGTMSWESFVRMFTDSEFIIKSKHFRELVFGNTGFVGRAGFLQERMMDRIHQNIAEWNKTNDLLVLRFKHDDELVYEIKDHLMFLEKLDQIKMIKEIDLTKLHIKAFRLEQISDKNYFMKKFFWSTEWPSDVIDKSEIPMRCLVEFKKIPKYFLPQIIKWFNKETVQDEDMIFTFEGVKSKFLESIFAK